MKTDTNDFQPTVFLSYRRQDTGQVVSRLLADLVATIGENRIFYDRENLHGGDRWKERLKEEVGRCSVFLALIGKGWLHARNEQSGQRRLDEPEDWVRSEMELALEIARSNELLIVPLLVDDAKMPEPRFLPTSIQSIVDHQALPLRTATTQEWNGDLAALLEVMREKGFARRVPSEHDRAAAWLAAHFQDLAARFARHMAASELRPGVRPQELYMDLVVAERHLEKKESPEDQEVLQDARPLEDVLKGAKSPLVLIGEGGSGKTTSLLYAAARAADRAKADPAAAIPIYVNLAQLTKIEDVSDLRQLIADSVPLTTDWEELSSLRIADHRRFLFLFDSFNEIPEQRQRTCAVVLQRFVETQGDRHAYLIASRLVPHVERLARSPLGFKTFEILRLTPDQVRRFLQEIDLGSLYERMPRELRELAGNPFMLLAIARTLAGAPQSSLPRNRGRLYQRFAKRWMENEEGKRQLEYSYERVKEPLLAYLAKRMTSAGQTSLAFGNDLEQEIERQLEEIHQRIKRLGGMPADWTVDGCLDEILGDGLLKEVNGQVHFLHQSVQEYFTALYFRASPRVLVDFTPKLVWEYVPTHQLAEVPNHRFASPLLMMAGLLDDSTNLIKALAARNPLLAAAAISSANWVKGSLHDELEEAWLDLLEHDDLHHRIAACSCFALASMTSRRVIRRLVALAPDFETSMASLLALERLDARDVATLEMVEQVLRLADHEYEQREFMIGEAVKMLQTERMVSVLFEWWRVSPLDSSARARAEGLLATVDRSLLTEELQRIGRGSSDPSVTTNAERALAAVASWERVSGIITPRKFQQIRAQIERHYIDRITEASTRLKNADAHELTASLRSSDPAMRAAAAKVAAERSIPVGDVILESLLRVDRTWDWEELISALVLLWGEPTAVSKLVEGSRETRWYLGNLSPELTPQLKLGELSKAVKAEIERIGVIIDLTIVGNEADGGASTWLLSPPSWGLFRPLYRLRASPEGLELFDCNVPFRAFEALAQIPGEASFTELRHAVEHDDPNVRLLAIRTLAERGDQSLAATLIAQLSSATSDDFIWAALDALGRLRAHEAVCLVDHLLMTTEGEFSDVHPIWGPSQHSPGWAESIHKTLLDLDADDEIQQALDKAHASEDSVPKVAALKEFSRWLAEADLSPARNATWRMPERLERVVFLALSDPSESVRSAAAEALGKLESELVHERLLTMLQTGDPVTRGNTAHALGFLRQGGIVEPLGEALADSAVEVRLGAGEALVRLEAREMYGRVAETMLQVARADHPQDLRRRAGRVLSEIPAGVEPFDQPIQAALGGGEPEQALELIEATLDVLPEDVDLFWWRGHALWSLGRLQQAAESYKRAMELATWASEIPQALAQTFLELGDYPRAMETARRGVEIAPDDAEAQSILAWSSYKAGAIQEAVHAASTAVDLDPVHSHAVWFLLLGHIRQANLGESRSTFQHARRVRQLLIPDLDTSLDTSFLEELEGINPDNVEFSGLIEEIKEVLLSEHSSSP